MFFLLIGSFRRKSWLLMKRLLSSLILIVVTLSVSTVVYATSSKTYKLDDLGMSIDIPNEYIAFTRSISDNDPNLSKYGLNKGDLTDLMVSRNIYLNAWDDAVNFEIIVTMVESSISDFNLMSDTMLNTLASSFKTEYANSGITLEKYEIFQHNQAKFIKIYINQPNGTDKTYGLQYYTVYDNKAINLTIQSYSGKIDFEKETILKSIVSTVHFDKAPMLPEISVKTNAFVYKDNETGCEFTVPANWSQEPLSQNRESLDIKFTSNEEPGLCILYGSTDMWTELSSTERKGLSRAELNNSVLSLEDLAETMGIDQGKLSTVLYGGKEYYKYMLTSTPSTYGINIEITITCLMRVENGYAYVFQFFGDSKNAYYKDFESLVSSVKYPAVKSTSSSDIFGKFSITYILFNLLITIAIYSSPIIIYRCCFAKRPIEKSRAKKITIIYGIFAFIIMSVLIFVLNGHGAAGGAILLWSWVNYKILTVGMETLEDDTNSEAQLTSSMVNHASNTIEPKKGIATPSSLGVPMKSQSESGEVDVVFCRKCGTKLNANSHFCHKCGTKVVL